MPRNSQLPVPTAKEINDAHRMARSTAESAVEHAIRCGKMLLAKKAALKHGEFQEWVTSHCDFAYSTAARYMKAGQNSTAVEISSLSRLFPSGHPGAKPKRNPDSQNTSARSVKGVVMNPPESAAQGSEARNRNKPIGVDAGTVRPLSPAPESVLSDDWKPEIPDEKELEEIDREIEESEAKILRADDATTGYHKELKRQAAEIATLKITRDGYMNGKAAVTRMLEAEQRKVAKLEKELGKLRDENERLRERVAIMEAA